MFLHNNFLYIYVYKIGENALCRSIGENIIYGCNDSAPCINPQFVKIILMQL